MVLWWIALPAGPAAGWRVFLRWPALDQGKRRKLLGLLLTAAAIAPLTTRTAWSFRYDWIAAGFLMLAWFSVCALVAIARATKIEPLSIARTSAAALALIVVSDCLWTAFWRHSTWDVDELQTREVQLGDRLVERRISGGMLALDWEGVRIIQRPAALPFLERQLYSINIADTEECNPDTIRVLPDRFARTVTVQCGDKNPYVWARVRIP